ncbi:MAG: PASTA domain-containing protein [Candidatus Latescibacteria bacterium]|nr:PASTA domain-containing protein [Candidatus Latescibacterota bacterium]
MAEKTGQAQKRKRSQKGGLPGRTALFLAKHLLLASAAFVAAGTFFVLTMDQIVMPFYQRSEKTIQLPDVTGMSLGDAERLLRERKLSIRVEKEEYHNDFPAGTIYLQIPSPGTPVKPDRRIRVRVSNGARPRIVPNVVGMSPRNARLAVQDAGLIVEEERWIPSNDYPNGIVSAQEPPGEEQVPGNTGIVLLISNGRRVTNIVMPNLVNLGLSAAKDTLRSHNFILSRLRVQKETQPDLLPDTVIEQFPDPGQPANTNEEVILIVSAPKQ